MSNLFKSVLFFAMTVAIPAHASGTITSIPAKPPYLYKGGASTTWDFLTLQEAGAAACAHSDLRAWYPIFSHAVFVSHSDVSLVDTYTCWCTNAVVSNKQAIGQIYRISNYRCPANSTASATNPTTCTCDDPYVPDPTGTSCILEQYTLSLQITPGQAEPSFGSASVIATVKDAQGQPKNGAQVSIEVEVEANSGGHDHHHDAARPKGSLSGGGSTGPDGTVSFTFDAPEVSGTHTFTAQCDNPACANDPVTARIDVKVEGLETIPSSQFYTFIGANNNHSDNHYLTPQAEAVLRSMAVSYQFEQRFKLKGVTPPLLHLNDASLVWGGVFDLDADWDIPHEEHMRGTVIDIRANSLTGAISPENFDSFIKLAKDMGADAGKNPHAFGLPNQHFHVRLLKRPE